MKFHKEFKDLLPFEDVIVIRMVPIIWMWLYTERTLIIIIFLTYIIVNNKDDQFKLLSSTFRLLSELRDAGKEINVA